MVARLLHDKTDRCENYGTISYDKTVCICPNELLNGNTGVHSSTGSEGVSGESGKPEPKIRKEVFIDIKEKFRRRKMIKCLKSLRQKNLLF
jgi:hypothetical protein